jgi:hypothetical protein
MIENVEELRPELEVHPFGDAVVLEEGHVPLVSPGRIPVIPS